MASRIRYIVINGSRTGLFGNVADKLELPTDRVYLLDIPEESLWRLRQKFSGIEAWYLYDPKDLVGKYTHDIGPVLNLYNTFIKVSTDKQ